MILQLRFASQSKREFFLKKERLDKMNSKRSCLCFNNSDYIFQSVLCQMHRDRTLETVGTKVKPQNI